MVNTANDRYLEAEVLNADPVKLVGILYGAAVQSVAAARRHLRSGDIRQRSQQITKASEILNELMLSLNHEIGGDISRNLVELYAYMQNRLIEGNTWQIETPLAEVEGLLRVVMEAWQTATFPQVAVPQADPVPVSHSY